MIIIFMRTIILYLTVIVAMRIMGKRQIGDLQPSEMVVTFMISDLASIPMQATGTPLLAGVIPILTLIIAEVLLSFFSLKNKKLRDVVTGTPSIIVQDGRMNIEEMKKIRMNQDDLMEELRLGNCPKIENVRFAIAETSGRLSIILKDSVQPLTAKDLNSKKKGGKLK